MVYPKNVPPLERAIRMVIGILMVILALFGSQLFGALHPVALVLLIVGAVIMVGTGFIGFCPACAMVGRKPLQK